MINKPRSTAYYVIRGGLSRLPWAETSLSPAGLDLRRAETSERLALAGFVNAAVAYLFDNNGGWDGSLKAAARSWSIVPSVLSPLPYFQYPEMSFFAFGYLQDIIKAVMTIATTIQDM
jgi:hypothetical protein